MADNDIDRKLDVCEANSLTESRDITHYDAVDSGNVEGDDLGSIKPQPKIISTSRISGEHASEIESSGRKNRSVLLYEGVSQFREVNMQSPVGIIATSSASFEKEIGLSRSNEIEHKEKWGNQLHFVKDGFHAITHDPQRRTESVRSNSLSVIHPISSLSEHSYQKTSKEAYSFKNFSGCTCMDDLNSKGFDCRLEEKVTANSESGSTAQIDHNKAARNARAKNSMKIFPIAGSCSSLLTNKIDTLMQDHEISHKQDRETATSGDGVRKVADQIDNFNCSFKTEENIRSFAEYSNHPPINSSEGTANSEISGESETMFMKGKSLDKCLEVMGKMVNESPASSMTGLGENAMKNLDTFVTGLDLNEGINACGMNYCIQPVVGTVSSHSVIHVVAKAGIPRGLPMIPLKFEGGLNWKGSAETSAFHPAAHSKILDRKPVSRNYIPQGFSGIDLNVVAAEDSYAIGMHPKREEISSTSTLPENSCSDVSLKQAERLSIDLNCLYDTANNLDADTSLGDASNNVHWIGQGHQSWGNKMSGSKNHEKREFDFISRTGFDGLCAMQQEQVSNLAHAQQYLVASPNALQPLEPMQRVALLHPRLPCLSRTLPPQTHSKGSFYFGSTSHLPLSTHYPITSPYTRYHIQEHRIFHELLNPDTVPTSIGTPHLTHGKSIDNTTTSTSTVNVKSMDNLPTRGIKMDEATSFMFLTKNPINEHFKSSNQETWSATSMKRKEPEGGLNCFQGKSHK